MTTIARPDLNGIKARLGSLAPGKLSSLSIDYPAVAQLLIDCKHLVAYIEEVVDPHRAATARYLEVPNADA